MSTQPSLFDITRRKSHGSGLSDEANDATPGMFRSWQQVLSMFAFVLMVDGICWLFVAEMVREGGR